MIGAALCVPFAVVGGKLAEPLLKTPVHDFLVAQALDGGALDLTAVSSTGCSGVGVSISEVEISDFIANGICCSAANDSEGVVAALCRGI